MAKQLSIADLDLDFVPEIARKDRMWQECISLALNSGGKDQRYGALVKHEGQIIGRGWNRKLKKGEPFPFRTTFFLHAERAAIGEAMFTLNTQNIAGAVVYVAGLLVQERHPLIRRATKIAAGTCIQCAALYLKHNLSVALMSEHGWVTLSGAQAYQNTLINAQALKERSISRAEFRREISL